MSFRYNGDPSESTITEVRFLIGDTTEASAEFQDEEIAYLLAQHNDVVLEAAINALEQLASKWAKEPSFSLEGASVSYESVARSYQERANELRTDKGRNSLSAVWEKPVDQTGAERDYLFSIGMDDHIGTTASEQA